jgi:hypothetical protein
VVVSIDPSRLTANFPGVAWNPPGAGSFPTGGGGGGVVVPPPGVEVSVDRMIGVFEGGLPSVAQATRTTAASSSESPCRPRYFPRMLPR